MSSPTLKYRTPDGKVHDSRQIHGLTRDRRNGGLVYKRSWKAQKLLLEQQGCVFFKGHPKHRFVYIEGSPKVKRCTLEGDEVAHVPLSKTGGSRFIPLSSFEALPNFPRTIRSGRVEFEPS